MPIRYFHRKKQVFEQEDVYGQWAMRLAYGQRAMAADLLARSWASRAYGKLQDCSLSRKKIRPFVKKYSLDLSQFENQGTKDFYASFNEFFIRKFRPGKRAFTTRPSEMPAFAEGRYLGFESVGPNGRIPVKGAFLGPSSLIGPGKYQGLFEGGPLLVARLCPVDYHRFHFPDEGTVVDSYELGHGLHSVNPLALAKRPWALCDNKRQVAILETESFGTVAYIEVGAMGVGKIVQTYRERHFQRGQEKGYFLFGGSTVIVVGQRGRWRPSEDLLELSAQGVETYVELGDAVAQRA